MSIVADTHRQPPHDEWQAFARAHEMSLPLELVRGEIGHNEPVTTGHLAMTESMASGGHFFVGYFGWNKQERVK